MEPPLNERRLSEREASNCKGGGGVRLIERGWLCDSVFLTITRCVQ